MIDSLSVSKQHDTRLSPDAKSTSGEKVYFNVTRSEWLWNLLFMLSLSLTGLKMPLGNLLVVILLLREYKVSREGFIFKVMMVFGGYAMTKANLHWGVNLLFISLPFSFFAMTILKKDIVLKRSIIAYLIYAAITVLMSIVFGVESLSDQLRLMMGYLAFCFFVVPLFFFSGEAFDIHKFWNTVFSMMMIMCAFYILDGYVFRGWVMVPCSWIDFDGTESTLTHLLMYGPFSSYMPRKYPPGLYPMALLLYPLARYYKLKWWQWALFVGAMMAARTSSILFGLAIGYVLAQGSFGKYVKYGLAGIVVFTALYFVDDSMGYYGEGQQSSTLRIASTVNQFFDLSQAQDDEDLSEAGTGRMAQALPSIEYIFQVDREWVGFGFVDITTKNPYLIVENELVENPEFKYQVVTNVEISPVVVFMQFGFIGLIVWFGFVFGIYRIIKHLRYAGLYMNVAIVLMIYGVGGFSSWVHYHCIYVGAMAYAVVLLANKPLSLEKYPEEGPQPEDKSLLNNR
jgi:hypothetical protein